MCRVYIISTKRHRLCDSHPVGSGHVSHDDKKCWCRGLVFTSSDLKTARRVHQLLREHCFAFVLVNLKSGASYSVAHMPEYVYDALQTLSMLEEDVEVKFTRDAHGRIRLSRKEGYILPRNRFVDCCRLLRGQPHPCLRSLLDNWLSSRNAILLMRQKLPPELCQAVATMCSPSEFSTVMRCQ